VPGDSHPTSNLNEAPSSDFTPKIDNETLKMIGATWKRSSKGGIGEAGDFVENRSRGEQPRITDIRTTTYTWYKEEEIAR